MLPQLSPRSHTSPKLSPDSPGVLSVTILRAKDLAPMDNSGKSDPYCELSSNSSTQVYHTKVINNSVNPTWDETFNILIGPLRPISTLTISLRDKDHFSTDDFMGCIVISLKELIAHNGDTLQKWFNVDKEPTHSPKGRKKETQGMVEIKLRYDKKLGASQKPTEFIKKENPKQYYKFEKINLGVGLIGESRTATHKSSQSKYTAKIFTRSKMDSAARKVLKREVATLSKLSHPNILTLHEAYESKSSTYLIFEPVTGGELFDEILKQSKPFFEADAVEIVQQVLSALVYMNSVGIAHRDLRPENLLYDKDHKIKITDFGLSKDFKAEEMATKCGNPWYVAPEILSSETTVYGAQCDVWSLGVITYILLSGQIPFDGVSDQIVFDKILNAKYAFDPAHVWDAVSKYGKDFISKIFVIEPKKRMTAPECLLHPWITKKPAKQLELNIRASLGESSPRLSSSLGSSRGSHRNHADTDSDPD